jgi:hypothetical protein
MHQSMARESIHFKFRQTALMQSSHASSSIKPWGTLRLLLKRHHFLDASVPRRHSISTPRLQRALTVRNSCLKFRLYSLVRPFGDKRASVLPPHVSVCVECLKIHGVTSGILPHIETIRNRLYQYKECSHLGCYAVWFSQETHGVTSQKMNVFLVTAVKTSNLT